MDRYAKELPENLLQQGPPGPGGSAFTPPDGVPSGSHGNNSRFLALVLHLYCDRDSALRGDRELGVRIDNALLFQERLVEKTGLVNLTSANWHSPPDTAFTVQLLAPLAEVLDRNADVERAPEFRARLMGYVERCAKAIAGGGFHTPNHRWVVCSALAYAVALNPDLAGVALPYVERLTAETVDINSDGEFSERSTGIYNAVSNRALIIMSDKLGRPELLDPVRSNLRFTSRMLNQDGSVVTGMSNRQDRGNRVIPPMADIYRIMGHRDDNSEWRSIAAMLASESIAQRVAGGRGLSPWLMFPFLCHPELRGEVIDSTSVPERYESFFQESGISRIRAGQFSCTIFNSNHALLDLTWGQIHVGSAKLAASYFGKLRFQGDAMSRTSNGVRVSMTGSKHYEVGYHQPLGRPVTSEELEHPESVREMTRLEPFDIDVGVERIDSGIVLHLASRGGVDGVPFQLELCIDGEGVLETESGSVNVGPASHAILKERYATFRHGLHCLRVGPGSRAHRTWRLRGSDTDCGGFRLVIPFLSPLRDSIDLQTGYWYEPEDRFMTHSEALSAGLFRDSDHR